MQTTKAETGTLEAMRQSKGLTLEQMAVLLARELGESSRSHVSIWKIEKSGTDKLSVIAALAKIHGTSTEAIVTAIQKRAKLI